MLLAAGLTAAGVDWLLRTHPSLEKGETREHWLLPTLTVLVIGVALYTLPPTAVWWLGFGLGAAILLVVFFAEFVAVDPADSRYPFATAILTVLAFVIFLILAVALESFQCPPDTGGPGALSGRRPGGPADPAPAPERTLGDDLGRLALP